MFSSEIGAEAKEIEEKKRAAEAVRTLNFTKFSLENQRVSDSKMRKRKIKDNDNCNHLSTLS